MSRRSLFEDLSEARAGAIRDDAGRAVWLGSAAELAPSINAADDPQLANLIGGSTESTRLVISKSASALGRPARALRSDCSASRSISSIRGSRAAI